MVHEEGGPETGTNWWETCMGRVCRVVSTPWPELLSLRERETGRESAARRAPPRLPHTAKRIQTGLAIGFVVLLAPRRVPANDELVERS